MLTGGTAKTEPVADGDAVANILDDFCTWCKEHRAPFTAYRYLPATIASSVTGVVERFAADGLNQGDYLQAALKQPSLFCQSPATITRNIIGVVEHFAADGLKSAITSGPRSNSRRCSPFPQQLSPPTSRALSSISPLMG